MGGQYVHMDYKVKVKTRGIRYSRQKLKKDIPEKN